MGGYNGPGKVYLEPTLCDAALAWMKALTTSFSFRIELLEIWLGPHYV